MTEAEKNEIVGLVMTQISSQAVDFDIATEEPKANDLLTAVRETESGGYRGVTLKWDDVARIATELANQAATRAEQAKNDAVTAKNTANTILTQVQSKGTEITNFVATSKAEIETQKNEAVNTVQSVYQTDLETERNERIEADTEHSARLRNVELKSSVNRYEIDNLKAKAEGKLYRTETVEAEAYALDVPSSVSPYAELQKIGGKSVVWNQLFKDFYINGITNGVTFKNNNDGSLSISGTSTALTNAQINSGVRVTTGHIYYIKGMLDNGSSSTYRNKLGYINNSGVWSKELLFTDAQTRLSIDSSDIANIVIFVYINNGITLNKTIIPQFFDLTKMFGAGNEPTLEECKNIFSADYYPYDAGTIKSFPVKTVRSLNAEGTEIGSMDVSSVTSDLKSAGSVHDEWSNGKVTKRVKTVDISNLIFSKDDNKNYWYTSDIPISLGLSRACISNKLSYGGQSILGYTDRTKWYISGAEYFELYDDTATSQKELKNNYAGTILQFELETPTEETIPEIDNFIQVEGGGTLTFESDDEVHMPVPSTNRFVVDLTSTTEETT